VVPRTGLEPVRFSASDFKSLVSTDSTIPAGCLKSSVWRQASGQEYTEKRPACSGTSRAAGHGWWRWRESNSRPGPRSAYIYVCIPHSGCREQTGPRAGFLNLTPLYLRLRPTGIAGASLYLCNRQSAKGGAIWDWLRLSSEGECCRLELNVAS
jgi:hypothetical protein